MSRVITGCIGHETNTFSNVLSDLERFKEMGLYEGDEFFRVLSGTRTIGGAFIEIADQKKFELVPTIWNDVFAWGVVTDDAFDYMLGKLLEGTESADRVDGVLLQLHGAMVTQSHDGVEGYLLERVRRSVGKDVPIIATLDLHANISKQAVEQASILVGYDTYPHVDTYERGLEAANLMFRMLNHEIKPTAAVEKPPMMPSPQKQKTSYFPMKAVMELAHKIEEDKHVLNVSVLPGFPFADIGDAGMGIIVTTQDDKALAEEKAEQISNYAWSLRRHFLADVVPIEEAVKRAMEAQEGPIVLADQADNPGGGAPCDGTAILRELIKRKAKNVVICVLRDPEAVAKAIEAGVGNKVTIKIGGKTDRLHGDPVEVTGYVRVIADGQFLRKGPMEAGTITNLGRTVVLDVDGIEIILTEIRVQPTDLQQYRAFGIEPTEKKIIIVKSAVHFRAVHEPIAKEIIEVDAPGIHGTRLAAFNFKKIRRPMFPIDPETLGISELRKNLTET
jgi:microcystin degradation protein MlrC